MAARRWSRPKHYTDPVTVKGKVWHKGGFTEVQFEAHGDVLRRALGIRPFRVSEPARDSLCIIAKGTSRRKARMQWGAGLDPRYFDANGYYFVLEEAVRPDGRRIGYKDGKVVELPNAPVQLSLLEAAPGAS